MPSGTGRLQRAALGAAVSLAVMVSGCAGGSDSPSPTTPTINLRHEAGERAVTSAVNRVWRSLLSVYAKATQGGGGAAAGATAGTTAGTAAAGAASVGLPPLITRPLAADDVDCAEVTVRYYAADGREQPIYNPLTTSRVTAAGTCRVSGTAVGIDFAFDEMQASQPSLVANGTAQTAYESTTVTAELRSLRVPKQTCAYPTSGQIVARASEITVTVTFDGSATATGTYSWSGLGATFSIPLTGCTP